MQSGQVLEVVGDCSPGFDNIQRWAKNQGHEVLEASKNENEFIVKIRKH
jgi:tRNA 2-thiouridine synthesizing protein A